MTKQITRKELLYAFFMAACGCAAILYAATLWQLALPPVPIIIGFTLFTLLTLTMAVPAPFFGYLGLDRVSQIAFLLIFDPLTATIINVIAYVIWPFLTFYKDRFSWGLATGRALHNVGMQSLVLLTGGWVWHTFEGQVPLTQLNGQAIVALVAMALAMQVVNHVLMGVLARVRGLSFGQGIWVFANLVDLAMVPLAVFTAIAYNRLPSGSFMLLVMTLLLLSVLMRRFALNRTDLERHVEQLTAVNRLAQAVSASTHLDELAELTYAQCRKLLNFSSFHLVLYDESTKELDFVLHQSRDTRMPRRRAPVGEGLLGWLVENNRPVLISDWDRDDSDLKRHSVIIGEKPASWMGVPVTWRGRMLGAMSVQNFTRGTFTRGDLELMLTFAGQVGAAIANARLFGELGEYKLELEHKVASRTDSLREANSMKERLLTELRRKTDELDRLSKEDSLTGLFNRRYMDERLAAEIKRAERFGRDIAIAMADLDFFKRVNDDCSHSIGDEVLRITAQILRRACRSIDIISRYGGEEFVICFPETDVDSARNVCERIRQMMSSYDWEFVHPGLKVTISIGLAGGSCYDQELLQKRADKKLYEAKDMGRDRVCA
ncbi:MAG TPA: sensor domain-containing diguanylate cyclase [Gammaproteobacteria bacterium]|nr:sensor domain-containing diguanylate cyclase [Gammaproteobacteria bacterium]